MKVRNSINQKKRAITLIEILIAVTILGIGIIPVMTLMLSSRSDAQTLQYHMMAGELAASTLDKIMALEYRQAFDYAKTLEQRGRIDALEDMNSLISNFSQNQTLAGMQDDFSKSFRSLTYNVTVLPPQPIESQFLVSINVVFETHYGGVVDHRFEAVKFNDISR